MSRDMCADVKMEEGYMRMSIEYNNHDSENKILDAITLVQQKMDLNPDITKRVISDSSGNVSVEFGTEGIPRDAGDFCEAVLHELGIDHCSI